MIRDTNWKYLADVNGGGGFAARGLRLVTTGSTIMQMFPLPHLCPSGTGAWAAYGHWSVTYRLL